jgi:hypothetical protein
VAEAEAKARLDREGEEGVGMEAEERKVSRDYLVRGIFVTYMMYVEWVASPPTRNQ